jgi:hypothetical protein
MYRLIRTPDIYQEVNSGKRFRMINGNYEALPDEFERTFRKVVRKENALKRLEKSGSRKPKTAFSVQEKKMTYAEQRELEKRINSLERKITAFENRNNDDFEQELLIDKMAAVATRAGAFLRNGEAPQTEKFQIWRELDHRVEPSPEDKETIEQMCRGAAKAGWHIRGYEKSGSEPVRGEFQIGGLKFRRV